MCAMDTGELLFVASFWGASAVLPGGCSAVSRAANGSTLLMCMLDRFIPISQWPTLLLSVFQLHNETGMLPITTMYARY